MQLDLFVRLDDDAGRLREGLPAVTDLAALALETEVMRGLVHAVDLVPAV